MGQIHAETPNGARVLGRLFFQNLKSSFVTIRNSERKVAVHDAESRSVKNLNAKFALFQAT